MIDLDKIIIQMRSALGCCIIDICSINMGWSLRKIGNFDTFCGELMEEKKETYDPNEVIEYIKTKRKPIYEGMKKIPVRHLMVISGASDGKKKRMTPLERVNLRRYLEAGYMITAYFFDKTLKDRYRIDRETRDAIFYCLKDDIRLWVEEGRDESVIDEEFYQMHGRHLREEATHGGGR